MAAPKGKSIYLQYSQMEVIDKVLVEGLKGDYTDEEKQIIRVLHYKLTEKLAGVEEEQERHARYTKSQEVE